MDVSGIKTMLIKATKETFSRSQLPGLDANANRYTMFIDTIRKAITKAEKEKYTRKALQVFRMFQWIPSRQHPLHWHVKLHTQSRWSRHCYDPKSDLLVGRQ